MVRLILSNRQRQQVAELSQASNITYRKALNSQGFCQFDLFLADPLATPQYINPSHYVHVYSDSADTTSYANALWGGPLVNDYEIKPKEGVVTCMAAGMANVLEMSVLRTTASYTTQTVDVVVKNLLALSDNTMGALGLTPYTTQPSTLFPTVNNFNAAWGDSVLDDIYKICQDYAIDFDVRPDWTYAILNRQGVDNKNLVIRYGNQGNIQVDSSFKVVNQELANQVTFLDNSGNVAYVQNQTSVNFYGPRSIQIQDGETYAQLDALTKAQLYAARAAFPLTLLDNVTVFNNPLLPFDQIRVGDSVLFETGVNTAVTGQNAVTNPLTPLTLYVNNAQAVSLTTAWTFVYNSQDSNTTNHSRTVGTGTGWGEVAGGIGAGWPSLGSIGAPSGHGILLDSTVLEGNQMVAGQWQQFVRLSMDTGSCVVNVVPRWSIWNATTRQFTTIATETMSAQTLNTTWTTYQVPGVNLGTIPFNSGDKLYMDLWINVTSNSTNASSARIRWGDYGMTAGHGGSGNTLATPGYTAQAQQGATPAAQLSLLGAYNGLQRILAMEYKDRNGTMTLTLGNAIYKVTRNKFHEVRLYGSGGAVWSSLGGS